VISRQLENGAPDAGPPGARERGRALCSDERRRLHNRLGDGVIGSTPGTARPPCHVCDRVLSVDRSPLAVRIGRHAGVTAIGVEQQPRDRSAQPTGQPCIRGGTGILPPARSVSQRAASVHLDPARAGWHRGNGRAALAKTRTVASTAAQATGRRRPCRSERRAATVLMSPALPRTTGAGHRHLRDS